MDMETRINKKMQELAKAVLDLKPKPPATRHEQLIALLWDSMKRDPEHKDRVRTGWGTKTQIGLVACIERIFESQTKALGAIQRLMDEEEWSPDTLDDIARIIEEVKENPPFESNDELPEGEL